MAQGSGKPGDPAGHASGEGEGGPRLSRPCETGGRADLDPEPPGAAPLQLPPQVLSPSSSRPASGEPIHICR